MKDHFSLAMDAGAAAGVNGYISGIIATVDSDAYIDAVIRVSHTRLSQLFDLWLDLQAQHNERELQHVYEWPSRYHNYGETVGNPAFRLWTHTLSGRGRNKVASFRFLASVRPSPVNPQLTQNDNGRSVKEGVHIFVWKAPAMEYNYDITVEPKLGRYLAYVFSQDDVRGDGRDSGLSNVKIHRDGRQMAFSEGPVTFKAGGETTFMRFTTLFQYWWNAFAGMEFDQAVKPMIERDLIDEQALGTLIRRGNAKTKTIAIKAQANRLASDWQEAKRLAEADLAAKATNKYIEMARQRRLRKYGY